MSKPPFVKICWYALCICWVFGCEPVEEYPSRPRDPWVMRSVLDGRPRMITLALDSACYLAYDAQACGLYQAWRGGIHLNGAAFNNLKTIQPTSWGNPYWQEDLSQPVWEVVKNGVSIFPKTQFQGYRVDKNRITLSYSLLLPDSTEIKVSEQPEFHKKETQVGILRSFTINNSAENTAVFLHTQQKKEIIPNQTSHTIESWFDPLPLPIPTPPNKNVNTAILWLEKSGCNTCHETEKQTIGPGYRQIAARYADIIQPSKQLIKKVKAGGGGNWGDVPMNPHPHLANSDIERMVTYILSLTPSNVEKRRRRKSSKPTRVKDSPGFGAPLAEIHPAFVTETIREDRFRPRVGGMAMMPDGSLLVSTWDSIGAVYRLRGVDKGDTNRISIQRIAAGLAEPLGITVVDDEIFVLQKQELTQLIDHNGDGFTDEYKVICASFGVTNDFHEFSYGLVWKDGYFYANLGLAMRLMGHESQLPDRGRTIRIDKKGNFEWVNHGLRQPNGIGLGPRNELFITENQGRWVPACQLIHVQEGTFHGCRLSLKDSLPNIKVTPPAIWLPHDEIGNSPGQPVTFNRGPYQDQIIWGEVTHGGIKRASLEKVNGQYQGAVFRFSQGLEAGINRMVWGPDSALYVGGVGMNGNWGWKGKQYGLQRLVYTGVVPFEMLSVEAKSDGLLVTFTKPLAEIFGNRPSDYNLQQWRYIATENYGGPKVDLESLKVNKVKFLKNRRQVHLSLANMKPGRVIYLRLPSKWTSNAGIPLWTGEMWYTMNAIPEG